MLATTILFRIVLKLSWKPQVNQFHLPKEEKDKVYAKLCSKLF